MHAKTPLKDQVKEETVGQVRKHYQKPELKTYGTVRELTRGPGGSNVDGGSGMARATMMF
jgi:hypothetical protein